jgi:pSer/pThr/pTyr-binding forkhead associated (FHA) protein
MADVRLEITDGHGRRVVRVDTPVFTIGRRSKSDLCLAGTDVSRDHAQIACDGGRFILRDQKSRYGTFVNDQPVV